MSTSKLETVLEEVKALTPREQQKVRELLDSLAAEAEPGQAEVAETKPPVTEEELERILLAKGMIRRIPSRVPNPRHKDFKPLEVKGKPLSEIIIEERR